MIRREDRSISGLNAQAVTGLKDLAKTCAKGACGDLATFLGIPIGLADTECLYPPMYQVVERRTVRSPKSLIIIASDVKGVGRSRMVLILNKDDSTKLVDRHRSVPHHEGRPLVEEDKTALAEISGQMISKFMDPLQHHLPSDFQITPPVVTHDAIRGRAVPPKLSKLMSGYQLMMEVHFIDRSKRVRGGIIFLPDEDLRQKLTEGLGNK